MRIALTDNERLLLEKRCWNHAVATCDTCQRSFRTDELARDFFERESEVCPICRANLTASIREHLLSCSVAEGLEAEEQRARSGELLDESAQLHKQLQQERERSELLIVESEHERSKKAD